MNPIIHQYLAFLDLETTGLKPNVDKIVEIGVKRGLHGQGGTFTTLLHLPVNHQLPEEAAKVNQLTTEYIQVHGMHPDPALRALQSYLNYSLVIAHNAGYDIAILDQHYDRFGLRPFTNNFLCTKTLAVALLPGCASYSLPKLCQELGLMAVGEAHRAMGDVERTMLLFRHMMGKFETPEQFWKAADPYLNCCGRGAAHHAPKGFLPKHAREIDQFDDGPQQLESGPTS